MNEDSNLSDSEEDKNNEQIYELDEEGNRLYICPIENCKKEFYDPSSLKKHKINHGEKQYPCPYEGCLRKFLDNSKLRRHFLVHTVI